MIGSVAPIPAASAVNDPGQTISDGGTQLSHEHEFAAAMERGVSTEHADVRSAPAGDGMMPAMIHRLDDISKALSTEPVVASQDVRRDHLDAGDPVSTFASTPPSADSSKVSPGYEALEAEVNQVLENYGKMVGFSIRAQAIQTSAETTSRTFNQLMKGT
jgi:hypothetical protein